MKALPPDSAAFPTGSAVEIARTVNTGRIDHDEHVLLLFFSQKRDFVNKRNQHEEISAEFRLSPYGIFRKFLLYFVFLFSNQRNP